MNRDAKPLVVKLNQQERRKLERMFRDEGGGFPGLSSWARFKLLRLEPKPWAQTLVKLGLLDRNHPAVKELLGEL